MKRWLVGLWAVLAVLLLSAGPVLADGIIIIDPPPQPPPDWSPWLTIRYHRVTVTIEDQVAMTHVDQVFRNDSRFPAEGTYVFPLPPGAVVQDFALWVDGERLEGKVLPADQARGIYEDYVRRNQDPALLEYVGRDAVQARIFPIPPGAERRIELEYTQVLPLETGLLHYRYPLNTERFSAYPLEQVSITVDIRSQTPLRALYSPTHQDQIAITREGERQAHVSYEAAGVLPDRDFELYLGRSPDEIGATLLTYRQAPEDGFFLLILSPSVEVENDRVLPKDLFLVLDTSGSMEGEKLQQAKEALRYVLRHLNPEDRFNVIAFSTDVRTYAWTLQPATKAGQAVEWVGGLEALGGTNIYMALSEALAQADPARATVVIFLTDGLPTEGIVDEQAILAALDREAPATVRIFPFGVGYDVNTLFLDQLAQDHKGLPAYVTPGERLDEQVSAFYARIQSPLLTEIALDFGDVATYDLYPQPLPDLYAGSQLIVTGRYTGSGPQLLRLTGQVEGRNRVYTYEGTFKTTGGEDFIPRLWAARKIGYLLTQIRLHGENAEWVDAIVTLSLRYGIITPYTSFLVEENAPLTAEQRAKAPEQFAAQPTPSASGVEAVQEAESRLGLGGAQSVPPLTQEPLPQGGGGAPAGEEDQRAVSAIRYAGDKTFLCTGSTGSVEAVCVDTLFVPDQMTAREIGFGTATYWQLVNDHSTWRAYLALAPEVTFVAVDGTAYHILPGGPEGEPVPVTAEPAALTTPVTPPTSLPEQTPTAGAGTGGRDGGLCGGALALALLVMAAWVVGSSRR